MASSPTALTDVPRPERAAAVEAFNGLYGEMNRALWCLSQHCQTDLLERRDTRVLEEFVWALKSWWGVQGVRSETKALMAQALSEMDWSPEFFNDSVSWHGDAARFAFDRVFALVDATRALGVARREVSLASKVLHWLMPARVPIYDSFVRGRLRVPTGWDHPAAYRRIAETLFDAVRRLETEGRRWLGEIEPRSILGGLDKYLWWEGGGLEGNAVVVRDPWRVVRRLGLDPGSG